MPYSEARKRVSERTDDDCDLAFAYFVRRMDGLPMAEEMAKLVARFTNTPDALDSWDAQMMPRFPKGSPQQDIDMTMEFYAICIEHLMRIANTEEKSVIHGQN